MNQTHEGSTLIVRIRMLGTFEVSVGGRPVPKWHGRLGRSILAYLLVQHQRSAAKDRLLHVFWPNVEPRSALNRLHVAISSLRKSLRAVTDRPVIDFDQENYQIARSCAVQVDVDEFEQNVKTARRSAALGREDDALARYDGALECYRGDLLPDMPYEEWTLLPREALRVAYVECLGNAARLHMSREEYSDVLRLGWAILATDPAHEEAHRLIMRCHAANGQPHQALRQFEICCRELATILGVEPAHATVDLLDTIRSEASTTDH
jgi:DNA-binding SARP family transcriptional activator